MSDEDAPAPDPQAPSDTTGDTPESPAPRPKRKKRARPRPIEGSTEVSASELPAAGSSGAGDVDERVPAFARTFPRDPALDALVAAFEAGDYARVRREAPALARQTDDDAVRRAARELRRRLDPDPAAVYMLLAAAALLVFLAGWYWLHPHLS